MATTKPNQIKIAELDDNAKVLAVQTGQNSQEVEVPSIRAVPVRDIQQNAAEAAVEQLQETIGAITAELAQVEQVVSNPAEYSAKLGETVIFAAGENLVINPPNDDPGAVTVDVENENLIFRSEE